MIIVDLYKRGIRLTLVFDSNVCDGVMKVTLVMKVLNIKVLEHGRSKAHRRNLFAKPANLHNYVILTNFR